jgi:hypothetical protein
MKIPKSSRFTVASTSGIWAEASLQKPVDLYCIKSESGPCDCSIQKLRQLTPLIYFENVPERDELLHSLFNRKISNLSVEAF